MSTRRDEKSTNEDRIYIFENMYDNIYMKKWDIVVAILLFILGTVCFIFFEAMPITILEDSLANKLLCGFFSRLGMSFLFVWLLLKTGGKKYLLFDRSFLKTLLWSLPCFMVAFINFPYSALINGTASIERMDLMGLYILYVIGVALLEELIFRGVAMMVIGDLLKGKKHKPLLTALISSLVFSLFHLTNLFAGADFGSVMLQCLYTFLIGGMLAVTILKGGNVWLCVLIHALFDFGGLLIIQIGTGNPWDLVFWILTIVGGVLCAGHIMFSLLKLERNYVPE